MFPWRSVSWEGFGLVLAWGFEFSYLISIMHGQKWNGSGKRSPVLIMNGVIFK